MVEEIELLWRLHGFTRVLMVNHLSCRAYDDLTSGADGRAIHAAHLQAARPEVERLCAGAAAEAYLIEMVDGALRASQADRELV
jgi:hypothetical protein